MAISGFNSQDSDFEWSEALRSFYFRARMSLSRLWWVVVICVAIGVSVKWYQQSQRRPEYRSYALMVIDGQVSIPEGARYQEVFLNFFGTQIKLMNSQQVRQMAEQRVAALYPELKKVPVYVSIQQSADASAFDLSAVGSEPKYTQQYLDALMHEFLAYKEERRNQTTEKVFLTVMEKVLEKQEEIEALEEEKLNFQRTNNIVFITEQGSNAGTYLAELNNRRAELRTEIRILNNMGRNDGQELDALTESKLSSLDIGYEKAKRQVEQLKAERDEFSIYMKPAHPKIRRLNQEIERQANLLNIYRRQTLGQLDDRRKQLEAELTNLDEIIAEWEVKALKYSTLLAEFDRLNSRLDSAKTVHARLLSSIESIDITQNTHQETISVLQHASQAQEVPMDTNKQIVLGGVMGLLVGCGILALLSMLDTRVVSAEDIGARFSPPVLGVIPLQVSKKGSRLQLLQPGDDRVMFAESCRNIRSSLLFMDLDGQRPQVILLTSAVPAEGKSTLASNLSITLAFAHSKTLLVDADLRRGRVHTEFDIDSKPGLAELIEDPTMNMEDVTIHTDTENLDVIPCGDYPERPGELLLSQRFQQLLQEMRDKYDYVIFDCPPVLATDDTPTFATKADAVLFMVRSNSTRSGQIKSSLDILELRGVAVDGFVLNFVDTRQPSHYYYYNRYNDYYNYRAKGKDPKAKAKLNAS
ncbi:polysaccharide biosynthesis tyrosine autokinase [Cerasicoccus fimbriatus]|uniref:polysaccharide biosynthesis tyrosine autokinase n=1 Tax=Cerasicoccus fimbriatus TaxID=3014554 RepID=UPI0022B5E059|nr:polysaccharide biosynthesis tyrosine autokinase [Cerasicoccus sp. TK19100]